MDRFVLKRPRSTASSSSSVGNETQLLNENVVVEIVENDIVSDPGLRKSIDSFDVNIQDRIRREYVAKDPCQPKGHAFPKKGISSRNFKDDVIDRGCAIKDKAYQIRLTASLDVIRFCLGEGLPFRGHDESSTSIRPGTFLSLLRWYSLRNEEVGNTTLKNAPGNSQMTCPSIQKDIINCCAVETRLAILSELGDGLFSITVDESRDCSIKEQMAIVIRYVNNKGEVVERFLYLIHVKETTSICLKEAIDLVFSELGLSMSRLRGQGYDGASNMRGEFNGLKALILRENPSAWYIHCFAHQIQLVCVAVFKANRYVSGFFSYLGEIVTICGSSCKRADKLRQTEHDRLVERLKNGDINSGSGRNQETSLRRPGDTLWGSHYITILRLEAMWPSVIKVLENIFNDGVDATTRGLISGLIQRMESYEFVFIMMLMKRLLGFIHPLSLALQAKDQDILNALNGVEIVKERLQTFRESGWDSLCQVVNSFCEANEIDVVKMDDIVPRRIRVKRDGTNITNYHHYRVEIFYEVVDSIIQEMGDRFSESSTQLLKYMACLNPRNNFSSFNVEKLIRLAKLYPLDFSEMDLLIIRDELENFLLSVRLDERFFDIEDLSSLSKKMVETMKEKMFPLVYRLIVLVLLLPVATATVERVFSGMKYCKSELRNRMGDKYLNDCLLVYIEKALFIDISNERILKRFQDMATRKNLLPKITSATSAI